MRIRFHFALICAVGLTATAAMAQTALPPASPEAQKQASSFVQSYAASTAKLGQIARWGDALCIDVTGIAADKAAAIKARVEDVAKALNLATAPAGCGHNVEVMFTDQPQTLLDDVAKRQEWFLGYNHRDPKAKIVTNPIQAWYVTMTVGGGGPNSGALFASGGGAGYGLPMQTKDRVIDDATLWTPTGCGDNHFTSCLKSVLGNVLVVVDTKKVQGKSVGLLSDYVAMLVLSQPSALDHCNTLSSITDLFVEGCGRAPPQELTPADAAYLTALYTADPEAKQAGQQAAISGRMAQMLTPGVVATR